MKLRTHLPKYNFGAHFLTARIFQNIPFFRHPACARILVRWPTSTLTLSGPAGCLPRGLSLVRRVPLGMAGGTTSGHPNSPVHPVHITFYPEVLG